MSETALVKSSREIVYLSFEETELKTRIASVRATYKANDPEQFAQAFTGLLKFLED